MRDALARSVATHFATCTAFSLSAIAAPFVPEVIAVYAGIRYLTAFLYGPRQWQAPARIPLHLGKRGYRDATTRKRGAATWPIGLAGNQQVWLLREDLAEGCAFFGDDPDWQRQAIEQFVFGACLNQMGAIIVQDHETPPLAKSLAALACPFGRDREMARIDLHDPLSPPLRITIPAIADTLACLGLSKTALTLNAALAPILNLIATRHRRNSLPLYGAILDKDALDELIAGRPTIEGLMSTTESNTPADGLIPHQLLDQLKAIPATDLEQGRQDLEPFAREIAGSPGLSLTQGLELDAALASRRLVCIRPSSPFTAALAVALTTEALSASDTASVTDNLVHVGDPAMTPDVAQQLLMATSRTGASGSIALKSTSDTSLKFVSDHCRIRFEHTVKDHDSKTYITSSLKDCQFSFEINSFVADATTDNV